MLPRKFISDSARVYSGNSIPQKVKAENYMGLVDGTSYVATKDISNEHVINYDNGVRIPPSDAKKFKLAPKGSTLICAEGGSAGKKVAYNEEDIFFVNKLFCLAPNPGVLGKYIYYYLLTKEFKEAFNNVMTGLIGGVSLKKFKNLPIPVMPEAKQVEIIDLLDKVFEQTIQARKNVEKNILNAKELFTSAIDEKLEVFFQKTGKVTLGELCKESPITYGVIKLGDHIESGVPCLRTSNVKRLNIETKGMKIIAQELSEEYSRTILKGGEVLVNVRGTLGGVSVVPEHMKGWNISREVACVPISELNVMPEYVAYWVASKQGQEWLTGVQKGAAYTGINLSDLRNLPIYIPSMDVQLKLVQELDKLKGFSEDLSTKYQISLNKYVELENSILEKAFNGELA